MNSYGIVKKKLICLYCGNSIQDVDLVNESVICKTCHQSYPLLNGIPVIINENKSVFSFSDFLQQKNLFFDISKKGKIISFISSVIPSIGGNNLGDRNFKFLEKLLINKKVDNKPRVLILGGSIIGEGMDHFIKSTNIEIVESDVSIGPRTQIIFDAHYIPYENESFDCIIAQAVLEHVINPEQCVREIHRVLKPDGIAYAETPFIQQVHGGAYDFTRYTKSGHRSLFKHFKEVKSAITAGSGTALAWSYQYFLLSLFGYNRSLRLVIKLFARITGFWIKYLDYLTKFNSYDSDGASGFYFIGQKSSVAITDKELIDYYTKNRN